MRPSPIRAGSANCSGPLTALPARGPLTPLFVSPRTYSSAPVSCAGRSGQKSHSSWRNGEFRPRVKMKEQHIVPLAHQVIGLFQELRIHTGGGRFVFPALGRHMRPMSENTISVALRRIGYSNEQMTAHGFRSVASTLLNERGWNPDLIELQLAHKERNKVRAAYNRAQRLAERRQMMQAWADYLVRLKEGAVS